MRYASTCVGSALVALLGLAGCADTSTPNPMQRAPQYGFSQEDRFVTARGGTSGAVQAPIVPGTGQVMGGLGNAEVQRAGATGPGAEQQGVVPVFGGENRIYYVPADQAAQYQRRPRTTAAGATTAAASTSRGPSTEETLAFSRTLDRAQGHLNARRNTAAISELERAETMVMNARTPSQPYDAALRDLATARTAAGRGDSRAANEALNALKGRLRAPA